MYCVPLSTSSTTSPLPTYRQGFLLLCVNVNVFLKKTTLLFILTAVVGVLIGVPSVEKIMFAYLFLLYIHATSWARRQPHQYGVSLFASWVLFSPGEKLCSADDCVLGTGVYLRHGYIHSSLAGYVIRKSEGKEVTVLCSVSLNAWLQALTIFCMLECYGSYP